MTIRTYSAAVLAAALMISIPATSAWAAHRSEAEAAIAAAKAAFEQATAAGAATGDTAGLIEQAEALLPSRQYT
jgi:type II secretory pathway pseudopilin PulG